MCGIIGYLGNDNFIDYILKGLKLIQNRGYDSVGVSFINNDIHTIKRASNNVFDSFSNVLTEIENRDIKSRIAIGHTRWATHGSKTDINAHPHSDSDNMFAIVHNGIIENYLQLSNMLKEHGVSFKSQTDTEIVVALINFYKKQGNTILQSITKTVEQLIGTWAFVIICKDEPNKMWITRNGSPLLLGIEDDFAMVVSEQSAFSNYIKNYIPINNHDIIEISLINNKISFNQNIYESKIMSRDISNQEVINSPHPWKYWMEKEINQQPHYIMQAINNGGRINNDSTVKLGGLDTCFDKLMLIENLIILGCGTSFNAGLWAIHLFKLLEIFNTISIYDGAEFEELDIPKSGITGLLLLSQSGETRDLIRCLEIAKSRELTTIGVVNVVDSVIARETDCGVYLNAGLELAVASTKSFTNQCVILSMIVIWFAQNKDLHIKKRIKIISDLRSLFLHFTNVLNRQQVLNCILTTLDTTKSFFILGKNNDHAIANEAALKLKEIGYIHAEGFSSSALKHGPFALITQNLPIFIIDTNSYYHNKNNNAFHEVKARGANTIVISESGDLKIDHNDTFGGLLANVYLQILSLKISLLKDNNPDFPRNLAKVVTVD